MRHTHFLRAAWRRAAPVGLRHNVSSLWKSPETEARRYLGRIRWRTMTRQRQVEWARDYNTRTTDLWLFVLGLHGSGTTLLKTILEQHPRVRSMPREGQYYTNAIPQVVMSRYVRRFTERLDLFRLTEAD